MNDLLVARWSTKARPAFLLALALLASLAPVGTPALAAEPDEVALVMTTELFRETGYNLYFGQDVAIEGDFMVVGGGTGDDNVLGNCGEGLGYVYQRVTALEWREIARLTQAEPFECFGEDQAYSVAIHGDWIALGAPRMPVLFPDADPVDPQIEEDYNSQGAVLLYHRPEGGWQDATETVMLTEYDGSPHGSVGDYYDTYGVDVTFEGDDLVVGAPNFDLGPSADAGAVFVYREWLDGWERAAMLTSPGGLQGVHFGASLDASDGALAIGSHGRAYGGGYLEAGAWVYERPVTGWADTNEAAAAFGAGGSVSYEVAIDGPTLVAVAPFTAQAFLFERGAGGWTGSLQPSAELVPATILVDRFSHYLYGLDVQGDTVVIGAPLANTEEGEAYVYHRPADGWGVPGEGSEVEADEVLQQPNPNSGSGGILGDWFGWSTAIDQGIVVIGARNRWHPTFDTGEVNHLAGSVFLFEPSSDHEAPQINFSLEPAEPSGLDGWFVEPLSLTVEAIDDRTGVGNIRCALVTGGSFASYDSLPEGPCPYLAGERVPDGEWILFAASIDAAGNRSPVVSRALKIDTTDPTPFIELTPSEPTGPDGAWLPPLYVRVYAVEEGITAASGWCTLDPAVAPTTYEELRAMPFCGNDFWTGTGREYSIDEGHTLYVAAIDRAGNTSEVISETYSVARRPRVSIGLSSANPPSGGWYRSPVTVTVTGTSANGQPAPETRCVLDPASAPLQFGDLPATCAYLGGGSVSASGTHVVYAGSHDAGGWSPIGSATFKIDATPPTLACQGGGPAQFVIGAAEGTLTASVTDAASGPSTSSVSTTLDAGDLDSAGSFTATLTATDIAGNVGTVACAYRVGYGITIVSPTPGAGYKAGATVPLTFRLVDADGEPIPDATASSLLAVKKTPCRIFVSLDNVAKSGCPTYTASTDFFTFGVKTPKARSAVGGHDIGVEVRSSSGTTISFARVAFLLT